MNRKKSRSRSRSVPKRHFDDDKEKAHRIKQIFGYTNDNNPFGDTNLDKQFVWKKNVDSRVKDQIISTNNKNELLDEIEIIKRRRLQREQEKLKDEESKIQQIQNKQDESYENWLEKEKEFHRMQQKQRSELRIQQNRMKPIDHIVQNVMVYKDKYQYFANFEEDMSKPWTIFEKLDQNALEEALQDAIELIDLEEDPIYKEYLKQVQVILVSLVNQQNRKQMDKDEESQIDEMFVGKSLRELKELEFQVNETINNHEFKIDYDYWEYVLQKLIVNIAKEQLSDTFKQFQNQNEYQDEEIQQQEEDNQENQLYINTEYKEQTVIGDDSPLLQEATDMLLKLSITEKESQEQLHDSRQNVYNREIQIIVDKVRQKFAKGDQNLNKGSELENQIAQQILDYENSKPLPEDEERFDDQVQTKQVDKIYKSFIQNILKIEYKYTLDYKWIDQFKPRKPQYFNRIKVGFEWNKYNQTHYDLDNPPPKQVQGYKFNIFYPDLIDKKITPHYVLENTDNENFCIIKFKSGPPYEDIAFKILKKEWDFNDKHGFKCIFSKGVLHLYFNFKKYKYRR